MRKPHIVLTLIFFSPLLSYFIAIAFVKNQYQNFYCRAEISEKTIYEKKGNLVKLNGALVFDLKHNEIRMLFHYLGTQEPMWRGVVTFEPIYDFMGRVKSIQIADASPSISSKNVATFKGDIVDADIYKGKNIPLRFYKINDKKGVYFFKYATHAGFCVNEHDI